LGEDDLFALGVCGTDGLHVVVPYPRDKRCKHLAGKNVFVHKELLLFQKGFELEVTVQPQLIHNRRQQIPRHDILLAHNHAISLRRFIDNHFPDAFRALGVGEELVD
jgi:hypothetical protein